MKEYERVSQNTLIRRTPVIIRVDGKAFHTFTKQFKSTLTDDPFSVILHTLMTRTSASMMAHTQNAVFAYTQSDEISILLKDWTQLNTDQWFAGNVQKMVSISAAMATGYFNFHLTSYFIPTWVGAVPLFDSRVFNLPKEEVTNYFLWRQQDATRNSINMLGQHHFSHKELHGKSTSDVQDMLMLQKGVNWNDLNTWKKRGSGVVRNPNQFSSVSPVVIDEEIPIFTQDRDYIERLLHEEKE